MNDIAAIRKNKQALCVLLWKSSPGKIGKWKKQYAPLHVWHLLF